MGQVRRRQVLCGAFALALIGRPVLGEQQRIFRMAILSGSSAADGPAHWKVHFDQLEELGYREGRNLDVERRFADGRLERLAALAAELVALEPDIVLAVGTQAAQAAAAATDRIPIVFVLVAQPVRAGLVRSLGQPGTNATGLSADVLDIQGQRLKLLTEAFPLAGRVAVLYNPLNAPELLLLDALKVAGAKLGLSLRTLPVKSSEGLASAFATLENEQPDALYVVEGPLAYLHRERIVEFANRQRLAAIFGSNEFAEAGGLMAFSASWIGHFRAAATYVDRILKGSRPAELPVEQPTRFELVINLRTSKALGLGIPPSILLRADRLIE